jgi:hypothetical protein
MNSISNQTQTDDINVLSDNAIKPIDLYNVIDALVGFG